MRTAMMALAAATLSGCATVAGSEPVRAIESETIRYETTPCYGTCPVYKIFVQPDRRGTFIGTQHTAVIGERAFTVSPEAYRRFAARLEPYRPAMGEVVLTLDAKGTCPSYTTDSPSVIVGWTSLRGDGQQLTYDYGCDREKHRAMADALRAAPGDLPVAALIGR